MRVSKLERSGDLTPNIQSVHDRWKSDESSFHSDVSDVHEVIASNGSTALWLRVAIETDGARYHACVLRVRDRPIVLAEDDIAHPGRRWELRSSGLWADHNCETELRHWSYGLEAFALALDDPEQLVREGVGERVPLGWELDFESTQQPSAVTEAEGYAQVGIVHGLLLTKDGEVSFEAPALRQHWWGSSAHSGPQLQLPSYHTGSLESAVVPIDGGRRLVELSGAAGPLI
jgi:hypothetical protein